MLDKDKIIDLAEQSMRLGFSMGVTTMRLKVMENLTPYIDKEILASQLLTSSDVIQLVLNSLNDLDAEAEFQKMRAVMKGLERG